MKKTLLLLMAGWCGVAVAQTNPVSPAVPATNAPAAKAPTQINSDAADFDLNTRQAVYRGNVTVVDPQVKLTCGWLVVDLPSAGAHLSHVVAETNVVIDFADGKGQTYHVTAAKAVYAYQVEGAVTNETVTFTGSPKVETTQSTIESEPMIWDRVRNKFTFIAPKMISSQGMSNTPAMKLY
jgi:lipopolysaccharide transport protein LptA